MDTFSSLNDPSLDNISEESVDTLNHSSEKDEKLICNQIVEMTPVAEPVAINPQNSSLVSEATANLDGLTRHDRIFTDIQYKDCTKGENCIWIACTLVFNDQVRSACKIFELKVEILYSVSVVLTVYQYQIEVFGQHLIMFFRIDFY